MTHEIREITPTKSELRSAGWPRKAGVKPPRLRCCECGQFVSVRGVDIGYIEGIENGFVCPRCGETWGDPLMRGIEGQ